MTRQIPMLGLQIDSPLASPLSANYRPPTWPPPPDFPVVIDDKGVIDCVYGDTAWNLARWEGKTCSVPFGDGGGRCARVSRENADLLRQIAGWWLWGPSSVQSAAALKARVAQIRPLAAICSEHNILISELSRYPKMIDEVALHTRSSDGPLMISLLHRLLAHREALGFVILDEDGISHLARKIPRHNRVQTPYIPSRIWTYQLNQLRNFLDDFLSHKQNISDCFYFCLESYRNNAGSWVALFNGKLERSTRPFGTKPSTNRHTSHLRYHGPFTDTVQRFRLDGLFKRWVKDDSIAGFTELLNMVREIGMAYILNFTLMRVDEGGQLRAGCYTVENDTLNQNVHLLSGTTSKTLQDSDARWICSSSVSVAIEAMTHVARLRLSAALHNPHRHLSALDQSNPRLWSHGEEPWSKGSGSKGDRGCIPEYARIISRRSKIFDLKNFRITQDDLDIARAMTFGLNTEKFSVGKVWPFAWHQLRRTGVCNMLASGMVSESSLRYQLKHLSVVMTRYYGQNHFKLKSALNEEAHNYFLKEMYETVSRGFAELTDDKYFSPYGEERKAQILRTISERDHNDLAKAAKTGKITYRETLIGVCTQATCIYGGVTNIAACMGTASERKMPCENLIINKDRRSTLVKLITDFDTKVSQEPSNSPMKQSIVGNLNAAKEAVDVIDREQSQHDESC